MLVNADEIRTGTSLPYGSHPSGSLPTTEPVVAIPSSLLSGVAEQFPAAEGCLP